MEEYREIDVSRETVEISTGTAVTLETIHKDIENHSFVTFLVLGIILGMLIVKTLVSEHS